MFLKRAFPYGRKLPSGRAICGSGIRLHSSADWSKASPRYGTAYAAATIPNAESSQESLGATSSPSRCKMRREKNKSRTAFFTSAIPQIHLL